METEQYRKIKANLLSEVGIIENFRNSIESKLGEMDRAEEERIYVEFETEEIEIKQSEKKEQQ